MYIDAHIHLDQYPSEQLNECIGRWRQENISAVLAVSSNLQSSYQTLELKHKYPDFIHAAVGFHPESSLPSPQELDELANLVKLETNVIDAIGEVGLPHYRFNEREQPELTPYLEVLDWFADLAFTQSQPVILHAVHDKAQLALACLLKHGIRQAQFHWLKAPKAVVEDIVQAGYFISVTPEVCYRTRDQELTKIVPLDQLLLESDGPWSYDGPFKGLPATPLLLPSVAYQVGKIHNINLEEVIHTCKNNFYRFLQLK